MTLQASRINANGTVTVNDITVYDSGSLSFNQTVTTVSNNYWVKSFSNAKRTIKSITYGNGLFVAVSSTNTYIETSTDGYIWTNRTSQRTIYNGTTVAYGNGVFVIGGTSGSLQSSTDGVNWTARTSANSQSYNAITYGNGLFVGLGSSGAVVTSPNGTTWTNRTPANTGALNAITYGNGVYVSVGTSGATQSSTDGINWTNRTRANTQTLNAITYGNGLFVAGGAIGAVVTSPDGINWTNRTRANSNPIFALTYFKNNFIAFHANLSYTSNLTNISITTSNDGITWTNQNTVSYLLPMARTISNTVAVSDNLLVMGINPLVDISNNYANNGTFTYEQFLASPSFPNKLTYNITENVNTTALAIKNTSSAVILTNTYSVLQSLSVNNSIYQDFDGAVNTQIFTANGYWIKPAWANTGQELVIVNLIGGGGGAIKSSYLTTTAAGGGGAFVWGVFMSSQCNAICNVVVGTRGAFGVDESGSGNWAFAGDGGNSVFYHDSTKSFFLTAYGGRGGAIQYTSPNSGTFRGGGGGGWLGSSNNYGRGGTPSAREYGGDPLGGNSSFLDSEFGGGTGAGANSTAGISVYGGGGGGGANNTVTSTGGNSFYGGAGGSANTTASISLFLNAGNGGIYGVAAGLGGGAAPDISNILTTDFDSGGRGEVRVYTIRKIS